MALIRALAIHLGNFSTHKSLKVDAIKEKVSAIRHKFRTNVWTTRIVLPKVVHNEQDLKNVVEKSEELIKELGIDFVAIPLDYDNFKKVRVKLVELFSISNKLFFSLNIGSTTGNLLIKEVKDSVQLLKEIFKSNGEEACTRFAISFGGQPETAYFPDTAAENFGFSLSLRYVNDILNKLSNNKKDLPSTIESIARPIQDEAIKAQDYANMKFLGIDLSLSPWMKESVLKLIEELGDINKVSPGFYTSIWKLNEAITNIKEIKKIGFNEVMLPIAEDSLLKEYFANEKMTITELIGAISVCVAGLDMVAVSANLDDKIEKIILDSISISKARKKRIGIRLILTNSKAGSEIKLARFGKVPVIKV